MKITRELLKMTHGDHMKMLNAIFGFGFRITTNAGGGDNKASLGGWQLFEVAKIDQGDIIYMKNDIFSHKYWKEILQNSSFEKDQSS